MKGRQRLDLIWELTHCNVTGRHKASLPGIDWSSTYPLLLRLLRWFATGRLAPSVLQMRAVVIGGLGLLRKGSLGFC